MPCVSLIAWNLRLITGALILGGPPCSMFVGASASVHMRYDFDVLGNTYNQKVRLSNLIWANCVLSLHLCLRGLLGSSGMGWVWLGELQNTANNCKIWRLKFGQAIAIRTHRDIAPQLFTRECRSYPRSAWF